MQTPSRESYHYSPEDRVRTERVLATVRVFLAIATLVTLRLEARGTPRLTNLVAWYASLSLLVFLLSRIAPSWPRAAGYFLHFVDVAFIVTFAVLAQGSTGPLFVLFVFVLFGAAARWNLVEVLTTGILAIVLFLGGSVLAPGLIGVEAETARSAVMRGWYLSILTLMFGFLVERERASRVERDVVSRVLVGISRAPSWPAGLWLLFDECLAHFGSSAALLALEAPQTQQGYLWQGQRNADGSATTPVAEELLPADGRAYHAPAPDAARAWYVRRTSAEAWKGRAIVSATVPFSRRIDGAFAARFFERRGATSLIGADSHGIREWRARFVLVNPRRHRTDDLRFLGMLASQVAPSLHHQFLAHRLRSHVSATERARLARELHDGLIQSLIGLEMEIEVLRRQASGSSPPDKRLGHLQAQLRGAIGDVRDLVLQLRPEVETGHDVLRLIAELAGRLRRDAGLAVRLLSTIRDLDCRPRTCRELARLVQEALVNVRKHSGARSVTISISQGELTNRLVIEDDGRGFGFEGRWSLEQLEASELGPVVIKERVRAMGGTLVIDSQRGRGARVEVEWQRSPQ